MKRVAAFAAIGLAVSGCSTMVRGSSTDFAVETTPPGAQVSLSTGETCAATPCNIRRPRKVGFTATVSMPGYRPVTTQIDHHWVGAGTGTSIIGGPIGIAIDARSGANQNLDPNPLVLVLEPETPAAPPK